jgi:adenylate cyclase
MASKTSNNIFLFREQEEVACSVNTTILEATLAAKINHAYACGGQGLCSTCRVSITDGLENCLPRNKAEQRIADKLGFPAEVRLACQTRISGDIAIRRMVADKLDMDMVSEQFSEKAGMALGRQQQITIVFTDIVNYTHFAEKFPPYDIVHVLNRYYRIMNAIIKEHNGLISDVAGDGILAVFGTGTDQRSENSVLDAIRAVKGMNQKLDSFNQYLEENFNTTFGLRAGVHFGSVIVRSFDTGAMKKLAIIGDAVNYTSRIESANKRLGTNLLLSEDAYRMVDQEFPNHRCHRMMLKGKTGKYNLYEID